MKKLVKIKWEDLQVGDIFPDCGSKVTNIWDWSKQRCYELTTVFHRVVDGEEMNLEQKSIVSDMHLISVHTDEPFDQYEKTKMSKEQSHAEAINWITVEDAYNHFMKDGISVAPGLNGEITITPYKDFEPQKCRCITTNTGTFQFNGITYKNSARGDHDLMAMKDIVSDLSRSGLSDQWIARNLFLEPEAITRFKQLSGLKAAFNSEDGLTEDAWDPIRDNNAERRKNINVAQCARRYVRKYRALAGFTDTVANDEATDILAAARALGFDESRPTEMPKSLDEKGKVFEKELESDGEVKEE